MNSILQLLKNHKVVIPPIQRDYAQGRLTGKIPRIRERFLDEIVSTFIDETKPPLELDFIYGYTQKERIDQGSEILFFVPLDGQQRLTTLFLIYWYVAIKEGRLGEAKEYLNRFTYATRHSSRLFCEKLITFSPKGFSKPIDEVITDQPWFFLSWKNDPTIVSMLVVLRDIERKFANVDNVIEKFNENDPRIVFHLLSMEDLGLPDDLYIKMNSRGKELTDFEHFKSQFSAFLDSKNAKIFNEKIDKEWSDLFWNIFKEKESEDIAQLVDSGFLSYFWYITDFLIIINSLKVESNDWIKIIKCVYKDKKENIQFLFTCLDLFEKIEKDEPQFFDSLFYINESDYSGDKIRLFFNNPQTNLFRKCAEKYNANLTQNPFSIGEQLMLYAVIYHKLNNTPNFLSRIRKLRNMIAISEDQIRKEYLGIFLYKDVEKILNSNTITEASKLSKAQLQEEEQKELLIDAHPMLKPIIYKLEDHNLLRGTISVFDLDNNIEQYAKMFEKQFYVGCDYFNISLSMLTFGDYSQRYREKKRFGNKTNSTWRDLLTPNEYRKNFNNTKVVLKSYLYKLINDNSLSNQAIITSYLKGYEDDKIKPKDWIYYYIKYEQFRLWNGQQTNGFYVWDEFINNPYECIMMFRTQFNGRHWSPFLLELSHLNSKCRLENFGNALQYTHGDLILMITNRQKGFHFKANDDYSNKVLSLLTNENKLNQDCMLIIKQTKDGVDIEDRIEKCNGFINLIDQHF